MVVWCNRVAAGLIFALFSVWLAIIVAAQNEYGFGPFKVDPSVPHEGRYVFAGLMQLITLLWGVAFTFLLLENVQINPIHVCASSDVYNVKGGELTRFAAFVSIVFLAGEFSIRTETTLQRLRVCILLLIQTVHKLQACWRTLWSLSVPTIHQSTLLQLRRWFYSFLFGSLSC